MIEAKTKNKNILHKDIVKVNEKKISCDGGTDFGHPIVFLNLGAEGKIICPYCSKKYVFLKK